MIQVVMRMHIVKSATSLRNGVIVAPLGTILTIFHINFTLIQ